MTGKPMNEALEEKAKALFELSAMSKGYANFSSWEDLREDTREMYRDAVEQRAG